MKRGMSFIFLVLFFLGFSISVKAALPDPENVRAVYLSSGFLWNEKKISELEKIIKNTNANAIVIDYKESNIPNQELMIRLVKRFQGAGAYTIARIVTFQDSYFAKKHPEAAIKTSSGELWTSGLKKWRRYWLDPASQLAQDYNIEIAKQAVRAGFNEIQFDYIRFPTDGNMRDIRYPVFNQKNENKTLVMRKFFQKIQKEIKEYSPSTVIAIDVFGEVFTHGSVSGIGQGLADVVQFFDVVCPMAYPSHYCCGEFGVKDPTAFPYKVYYDTILKGKNFLPQQSTVIFRPWIQDFSLRSIYKCGPKISYGPYMVREQIRASRDLGVKGFMLWNVSNRYTIEAFE